MKSLPRTTCVKPRRQSEVFCTTIIPTVGQPALLRAVDSVLNQAFYSDEFEVVVVNDSGKPLFDGPWYRSPRIRLINTNRQERCVARNTGAAVARGRYLNFLDEDDWLLPDAFEKLRCLSLKSDAAWLYGGSQLVDRKGNPLIQLKPDLRGNCFIKLMAGEWIPPGASIIDAEMFFRVGGYNPHILFSEDMDLCRRIALHGDLDCIDGIVACLGMGEGGSTTDYANPGKMHLWGREKILEEPGAFRRMRESADSGYWQGRIVRVYLTSAVWNIRKGNLFSAAGRAMYGMAGFLQTCCQCFSSEYWFAILKPHQGRAFAKGFDEAPKNGKV